MYTASDNPYTVKCDLMVSRFAFEFELYRYSGGAGLQQPQLPAAAPPLASFSPRIPRNHSTQLAIHRTGAPGATGAATGIAALAAPVPTAADAMAEEEEEERRRLDAFVRQAGVEFCERGAAVAFENMRRALANVGLRLELQFRITQQPAAAAAPAPGPVGLLLGPP